MSHNINQSGQNYVGIMVPASGQNYVGIMVPESGQHYVGILVPESGQNWVGVMVPEPGHVINTRNSTFKNVYAQMRFAPIIFLR